jgi:hypothetical protein
MRKYSLTVSYRLRFSTVNPRGHRGRQAPAGADRDGAEREHAAASSEQLERRWSRRCVERPAGQRQQVEPSDDLRQPELPRGQGLQQRDARRGRARSEATTQPAAGRRHQRGRGDRSRASLEPSPRDAHAPPGESTPGQALRRWVRSIGIRIFMASARSTPVGRANAIFDPRRGPPGSEVREPQPRRVGQARGRGRTRRCEAAQPTQHRDETERAIQATTSRPARPRQSRESHPRRPPLDLCAILLSR